jgi:hypothetical protein
VAAGSCCSARRALFTLPIIDNGWSPYDTIDGQQFLVRAVPQQAPAAGVDRQLAGAVEERGCCATKARRTPKPFRNS